MSRLSLISKKLTVRFVRYHRQIQNLNLPGFVLLRWLFVVVYLITFVERLLDYSFISRTSLAYLQTVQGEAFLKTVASLILTNSESYIFFLIFMMLLSCLYAIGRGGAWVLLVFGISEFFYQMVSAGNSYGHEGFIHQFLVLLILLEIGQGRIDGCRLSVTWQPSLLTGLSILLLRWQLMVLYFMAGLSKWVSPEWQTNDILDRIFLNQIYFSLPWDSIYLTYKNTVGTFIRYSIIAFQLSFPFLILFRKTRPLILTCGIIFHLLIALKMGIYSFSLFMISLYLLFYEKDDKRDISCQKLPVKPSN